MIGFPLALPIDSDRPRHIELRARIQDGADGTGKTIRTLEIELTSVEEFRALAAWLDRRPVAVPVALRGAVAA
jgi:hypothetical protein